MKSIRFSSLLLLAAVACAASLPVAAQAQSVSPVPAPTIINSAPYTITAAGYYQLGANLSVTATTGNIITINAPNVTLDFAGHYISGPSNAGTTLNGVYASEHGNIIIQNGTIAHCSYGIYLTGNGSAASANYNNTIKNMLLTNCYTVGAYLVNATGDTFNDNRVSQLGGGTAGMYANFALGVFFDTCDGSIANNNTITGLTSNSQGAFGIIAQGSHSSANAANNVISNLSDSSGDTNVAGIYGVTFAVGNTISSSYYGLQFCTKYKDNLTSACTTPFAGGTAVGTNN